MEAHVGISNWTRVRWDTEPREEGGTVGLFLEYLNLTSKLGF